MKIEEELKKCVAFIALRKANGDYDLRGTVFFIGRNKKGFFIEPKAEERFHSYAVTAKHVITSIKDNGLDVAYIKVNQKNGDSEYVSTKISDWLYHDDVSVDIAVHPFSVDDFDHLLFPESEFVTPEFINEHEVDVGDEVIIAGLFIHHHGKNRNIPIIRVGNIAAMNEEKIQTENFLTEAYLIEARSIGGLSGSPVFTNLGITRNVRGVTRQVVGGYYHNLLGLIYGHFDFKVGKDLDVVEDLQAGTRINTGIAIVTPITKLIELLEQSKVQEYEHKITELMCMTYDNKYSIMINPSNLNFSDAQQITIPKAIKE
jgi:hypothetical protein